MDTLGKILFWIGFIFLIGVAFAYLILIIAGSLAFATTSAALTICSILVISALLMVAGRAYEHKAARKRENKLMAKEAANATSEKSETV